MFIQTLKLIPYFSISSHSISKKKITPIALFFQEIFYVTRKKSVLGGIYESEKTKINVIPHSLTMKDVLILKEFFYIEATGIIAKELGNG